MIVCMNVRLLSTAWVKYVAFWKRWCLREWKHFSWKLLLGCLLQEGRCSNHPSSIAILISQFWGYFLPFCLSKVSCLDTGRPRNQLSKICLVRPGSRALVLTSDTVPAAPNMWCYRFYSCSSKFSLPQTTSFLPLLLTFKNTLWITNTFLSEYNPDDSRHRKKAVGFALLASWNPAQMTCSHHQLSEGGWSEGHFLFPMPAFSWSAMSFQGW